MARLGSFEIAVRNMLRVAKVKGYKQARKEWGASPKVWDEVRRRMK